MHGSQHSPLAVGDLLCVSRRHGAQCLLHSLFAMHRKFCAHKSVAHVFCVSNAHGCQRLSHTVRICESSIQTRSPAVRLCRRGLVASSDGRGTQFLFPCLGIHSWNCRSALYCVWCSVACDAGQAQPSLKPTNDLVWQTSSAVCCKPVHCSILCALLARVARLHAVSKTLLSLLQMLRSQRHHLLQKAVQRNKKVPAKRQPKLQPCRDRVRTPSLTLPCVPRHPVDRTPRWVPRRRVPLDA